MGSGGGTSGGGEQLGYRPSEKKRSPIVSVGKPTAKKAPSQTPGLGMSPGQSQAMFGTTKYAGLTMAEPKAPPKEPSVRDFATPTDTPTRAKTTKPDTSGFTREEREMRAPKQGLSPGDVLATIGTSGYGQQAAAKLAGTTKVTKEQLGGLATRANIGQLPPGEVQVPGMGTAALNLLNLAGKATAKSILDKIIEGGDPVTNERGDVVGAVTEGAVKGTQVYTGQSQFNPFKGDGSKQEPEPVSELAAPVVEDVEETTLLSPTKKRGRGTRFKKLTGDTLLEGQGVLVSDR